MEKIKMFKPSNSNNTANFAYGFLTGGLIFGSLALLFAPKKGKAIRKDIGKATKDLLNTSTEYIHNAGDYLNTAKEKAEDFIADGTSKITKMLDSTESKIVDNAGNLVSEGKNKLNKLLDSTDHTLKTKTKLKN